jgi:LysM repeat protein
MPAATGTGISTAKAPAAADTAAAARACDTSGAADSKDQDRDSTAAHTQSDAAAAGEVLVRSAAADLIALLTSSWGSAEPCDAAGLAAAGSTTGGFLAGMRLPWNLGSHKQQQQAADARQLGRAGSSNAAAAGGGVRSCRSLVRVSRAQLEAAWQQLVAVSPLAARAALDQAAAAAALAPHAAATRSLSPSPASSGSSVVGGISNTLRRASSSSSSKGGAACAAPDDAGAASMPTCMHVVGHGETLASIAAACGVAVADLLAVNPELPAGEGSAAGLQHHDCIALPVPAVFPRLAVAQAGDSIHTIARRHRVPAGRLLKANPELRDAGRLQPGWVVLLPGLNGSSSSSIAMDCLAGVAAVEADAHHPAAAGAEDDTFELEADSWVRLVPQQEQQQERSASSLRQQDMPTAASWPGGATLQRQRLQQPRRSDSSAATRTNSGRPSSGSSGSSGSDEPFTPIPAGFVTPVSSKGSSASQQHRRQPLRNVPLPTVGSGAYLFVTRR